MSDARSDAGIYLLPMLLQRVHDTQPDLIQDMLEGVQHDQAAIPNHTPDKRHIDAIFEHALTILQGAQGVSDDEQK